MGSSGGLLGALLERLSNYSEKSLTRITTARDRIESDKYEFKDAVKDVVGWQNDTLNLWMPLTGSGGIPAAVIVMKNDQAQQAMRDPLEVKPPDGKADPVATDLTNSGGIVIAAKDHIKASWDNQQRGSLALAVVGLKKPDVGYYTGAVFVDKALVATVHLRVDPA